MLCNPHSRTHTKERRGEERQERSRRRGRGGHSEQPADGLQGIYQHINDLACDACGVRWRWSVPVAQRWILRIARVWHCRIGRISRMRMEGVPWHCWRCVWTSRTSTVGTRRVLCINAASGIIITVTNAGGGRLEVSLAIGPFANSGQFDSRLRADAAHWRCLAGIVASVIVQLLRLPHPLWNRSDSNRGIVSWRCRQWCEGIVG